MMVSWPNTQYISKYTNMYQHIYIYIYIYIYYTKKQKNIQICISIYIYIYIYIIQIHRKIYDIINLNYLNKGNEKNLQFPQQ